MSAIPRRRRRHPDLVVDNDQAMGWLWARILQWGFNAEVVAVFDGNTALTKIAEQRFDLVVTDLQMPGASRLDVLRAAARRDPQTPAVFRPTRSSRSLRAQGDPATAVRRRQRRSGMIATPNPALDQTVWLEQPPRGPFP